MSTNSKKLAGKVAIITGASKGIGAALAKALSTEGAAVAVNYSSSKADGDKVVNEISALGGKAIALQANISKQMEAQTPLGRIGLPQDIAGAAVFLASGASSWITGETYVITGGYR